MIPREQRKYVLCPYCGRGLRAERLAGHCLHRHGLPPGGNIKQVSWIVFKRTRKARTEARFRKAKQRATAERHLMQYVEKLKATSRKCATPGCDALVRPPEEFCQNCKNAKAGHTESLQSGGGAGNRCRSCGAPAMAGESYCYSCIGD